MIRLDLEAYGQTWRPQIDSALGEILNELTGSRACPRRLGDAMRYAVLAGGKRLRPLLCLASMRASGAEESPGLRVACALELVHAYSLVHDDLPAMDDDDFRRGQPTCHRVFGEAMAVLAGDALLTHTFGVLAAGVPATRVAEAVGLMAACAGCAGMVGGQADDVDPGQDRTSRNDVESVHVRKTASLFEAAVSLGGLVADTDPHTLDRLTSYGRSLGLAYQIADDLLAWLGDASALGRPTDSDDVHGRRTYPALFGVEASRERSQELLTRARDALGDLPARADALRAVVDYVEARAKTVGK